MSATVQFSPCASSLAGRPANRSMPWLRQMSRSETPVTSRCSRTYSDSLAFARTPEANRRTKPSASVPAALAAGQRVRVGQGHQLGERHRGPHRDDGADALPVERGPGERHLGAVQAERGEEHQVSAVAVVDDDTVLRVQDLREVGHAGHECRGVPTVEVALAPGGLGADEGPLGRDAPAARVVEDHREAAVDLVVHLERLVGQGRCVGPAGLVLTDVEELRQGQRDDGAGGVVGDESAAAHRHPVPDVLVLRRPRVRVDGQRKFGV